MIKKDFFDLTDDKLKLLMKNKDTLVQISKELDRKVILDFKNAVFSEKKESKKSLFGFSLRPALSYGFLFLMLIFVFTSLFVTYNIFKNKQVNKNLTGCIVKYISGKSYQLNETTSIQQELKIGDKLSENITLITDANSNVELELEDNSTVLIKRKNENKDRKAFQGK